MLNGVRRQTLAVTMLAVAGCGRIEFDARGDAGEAGEAAPRDAAAIGLLAVQIDVTATSNIWGAGHATPPAPDGGGGGVLPSSVSLPAGTGRTLELTSATGTINFSGGAGFTTADGYDAGGPISSPSYGGISDVDAMRGQILVAVALDDFEPADPAPPTGMQDSTAPSVTSIVLRQQFFVGDGLTGTGTGQRQTFALPDAATRLYFGFGDSPSSTGLPGAYSDNLGTIAIMLAIRGVPR